MEIALVGPSHPFRGGISHYTMLLCQHLRKRHRVRFFTFRRQYPAWLFPGRSDRDEVSRSTPEVEGEALLDGVNPLTWWEVARQIRRDAPDLLIVQWSVSYWIPLLWLLLRRAPPGTRTLLICHNAAPHEAESPPVAWLRRRLQRAVMAHADHLLCHADSDRAALHALLPDASIQTVMMPVFVGLGPAAPPREKPGDPHLLFFGFVRPYKGVDLLFEAMPEVLRRLPSAHLTVAGEWWKGSGNLHALLDPALRQHVTILDRYLANEEVASLFASADVVVLPYRSATQSAVVQLAYGYGVPVISTRVGGLPEAIRNEESGLLVPPGDASALASAIIRYHREGWRERLLPGVEAARERFSWGRLVAAIERVGGSFRPDPESR